MSDVYYPIDVVARAPSSFSGIIESTQIGAVGITRFAADAQRALRRKVHGGRDDSDFFALVMPTMQTERFSHLGRLGDVAPGQVAIFNSAEEYRTDIPDGTRNVTIKIPADLFRAMCPKIDAVCGRVDVANSRFVPLLTQFALQALESAACLSIEHVNSLERGLLELAFLMMDVPESYAGDDSKPVIDHFFHRVMAYIAANFQDPDLAPERAAQSHRVSIRYIHKIFQAHDTTFGRELRLARLRHAQKLLRENLQNKSRQMTIAEVAYNCGFSSQALFSVRFKEAFGYSPRDEKSH
ncbi:MULTISPECIES: AraC family transcriptional regulator [unclassified Pseudomonas]|uniref:AraC family transcriptional regulator n=1 Tax=unclassified Pseudomonas TaxID=196821 RepID=UPI00088D2A28|nr:MULTISPECIES: AraC family transcriptional regulator [unclassified Pseudomonas]SCZ10861.1 Helix-turn-helix domain-containing protein [Pseudomonas sp. NFACC37-1]SFO86549.1 Helix-turn-helix domain-containing protein [Pseudomonas sp. NFACC24-1]